ATTRAMNDMHHITIVVVNTGESDDGPMNNENARSNISNSGRLGTSQLPLATIQTTINFLTSSESPTLPVKVNAILTKLTIAIDSIVSHIAKVIAIEAMKTPI